MQARFTATEEAFRDSVRSFLADELTQDLRDYSARMTSVYSSKEVALAWQAILHKQGWAAPNWPVAYGGCDWSIAEHYIFNLELSAAAAPPLSPMGIGMCGPALIGHGSEAQRAHYLPRILSAEDYWCQGYSEPQAGSDLATLSMQAIIDGDQLVLNGTKIWTTHAHEANWMFCLVRTDGSDRPQRGITFVLLDMSSPGIDVQPLVMTSGEHIQNVIYFSDVRVPLSNIVGELHKGWTVAKYLLEFERGGGAYGPSLLTHAGRLQAQAKRIEDTEDLRQRLAATTTEILALEAAELRLLDRLRLGGSPGTAASMMKIRGTELSQTLTEYGIELADYDALRFQPAHTRPGGPVLTHPPSNAPQLGPDAAVTVFSKYLNDRAGSIYAGSNEIQRNILAKGQLGL